MIAYWMTVRTIAGHMPTTVWDDSPSVGQPNKRQSPKVLGSPLMDLETENCCVLDKIVLHVKKRISNGQMDCYRDRFQSDTFILFKSHKV